MCQVKIRNGKQELSRFCINATYLKLCSQISGWTRNLTVLSIEQTEAVLLLYGFPKGCKNLDSLASALNEKWHSSLLWKHDRTYILNGSCLAY